MSWNVGMLETCNVLADLRDSAVKEVQLQCVGFKTDLVLDLRGNVGSFHGTFTEPEC